LLLGWVAKLVDFRPFGNVDSNHANGWMMLLFGVGFLGLVTYEMSVHSDRLYLIVNSASEHGVQIDTLMHITIGLTLVVFFIVQVVLFWFGFKYRKQPGRKALYYADNHQLELIWTVVPAITLFILVGYGLVVWSNVHYPNVQNPVNIEFVAEQFQWRIRYAGEDNKLGQTRFSLTTGENPLAMDSTDKSAFDDRILAKKEIYLLKGKPYKFKIRSKDVLHGFYMPHFRVNIYAVPGMPTEFQMTPIKTTAEMQAIYGPKFEYELACSQLCGSAHYNMKVTIVVVDSEKEYAEWFSKQPMFAAADAPAVAPATQETDSTAAPSASTLRKPQKKS
jgi:cytochrome c oxidase subunit 2